jgi:hypothetical protein
MLWPFQPSPWPQSWRVWRHLLARAFLEDVPKRVSAKTTDLHLLQSLGNWLPGSEWISSKWSYSFSPSTGYIYHVMDSHYHIHHRRRRSRQRSNLFYNDHADCTTSIPADCIPVEELTSSPSILAFCGLRVRRPSSPSTPPPGSFFEYLSSLLSWDRRLLQHVEILDGDALVAYFSTTCSLFIVFDGGAANTRDSYGAVLATDNAILVKISGTTEGCKYLTQSGSSALPLDIITSKVTKTPRRLQLTKPM